MFPDAAHTHWWQTFEVVVGIPFLLAIALQFVLPLSFGNGICTRICLLAGVVLVSVGLLIVIASRRTFSFFQQPTDPGRATSTLITTGLFAYSRNPLYLGGMCLLVGLALAFHLVWGLIVLFPALPACQWTLILPEERYLAATFGEEYHRYAATVNRWVGRGRQRSAAHRSTRNTVQ